MYARSIGFDVLDLDFSPIKGPEGNIEYLVHIIKREEKTEAEDHILIENVVEQAHASLDH